ncbi:septal ring lytic transglycosylase RlpA family protein [Acidocella aromatica]|uniref:Endolytic peptidoglycan transglycosylase RlpA n=1 Tax=Acidocella aromatica TaxID=1303579 RepID=A0A840VBL1_9PROT|nr:septal ring lytic transglycosylase RlpA family protein [Acidocella aromatica]MBB5373096.1 rare lipoprotein A [Acidocella aromatica]
MSRTRLVPFLALALLSGGLSACATAPAPQATIAAPAPAPALVQLTPPAPQYQATGPAVVGMASWYRPGPGLHRTCTGEAFTRDTLTAASSSIPMGTQVRVSLIGDSRSIVVRVNDCMPHGHRIIDLSEAAAKQLGLVSSGVAKVTVTKLELADIRQ